MAYSHTKRYNTMMPKMDVLYNNMNYTIMSWLYSIQIFPRGIGILYTLHIHQLCKHQQYENIIAFVMFVWTLNLHLLQMDVLIIYLQ